MTKTCKVEADFAQRLCGKGDDTWRETVSEKAPIWTSVEQAVSMAKEHRKRAHPRARLIRVVMEHNIVPAAKSREIVVAKVDPERFPLLVKYKVRVYRWKGVRNSPLGVDREDFKRAVKEAGLSKVDDTTAYTMSELGMYPEDAEDFLARRPHLD